MGLRWRRWHVITYENQITAAGCCTVRSDVWPAAKCVNQYRRHPWATDDAVAAAAEEADNAGGITPHHAAFDSVGTTQTGWLQWTHWPDAMHQTGPYSRLAAAAALRVCSKQARKTSKKIIQRSAHIRYGSEETGGNWRDRGQAELGPVCGVILRAGNR